MRYIKSPTNKLINKLTDSPTKKTNYPMQKKALYSNKLKFNLGLRKILRKQACQMSFSIDRGQDHKSFRFDCELTRVQGRLYKVPGEEEEVQRGL